MNIKPATNKTARIREVIFWRNQPCIAMAMSETPIMAVIIAIVIGSILMGIGGFGGIGGNRGSAL